MNRSIAKPYIGFIAIASLCLAPLAAATNTVVDVMVVYTPGVTSTYSGDPTTRINQLIALSNQIYTDSGVSLELHLVKTVEVNYPDTGTDNTALGDIKDHTLPALATIGALRDQYKADVVVFYRKYDASHNYCGLAYVGGFGSLTGDVSGYKSLMYGTMSPNTCPDFVTAHELGHNMGLRHSRRQDTTGGAFPYALGHGVDNQFTTIMAYESEFGDPSGAKKVYKFSSPFLVCNGAPCGVVRTDASNGADAVYALSVTTPQVAEFYPGSVSVGAKTTLEQLSDAVTDAGIAYNLAVQAVTANAADIAAKTATQKAAQTTLADATKTAKTAATLYATAIKIYNKSAATVTTLTVKVAAALAKYNASTTDALRAKNLAAYNLVNDSYAAAVTKAATDLSVIDGLRIDSEAKTTLLVTATTVFTAAKQAVTDAKALTAALKAEVAAKKVAQTAAAKAYAAALKKK